MSSWIILEKPFAGLRWIVNRLQNFFEYTRSDAFRDGVLIDVSLWASKVGFIHPVAMSRQSIDVCIGGDIDFNLEVTGRNKSRLMDIMNLAAATARVTSQAKFRAFVVPGFTADRLQREIDAISLVISVTPGDDLEPCLTIMLPEEV